MSYRQYLTGHIQHWSLAAGHFSGDLLIFEHTPEDTLHVMLADFTGHGLVAAVGALPTSDIFYAMTQKGFGIGDIACEINRKLHWLLPTGQFCCASLLSISPRANRVEIWNGGLPPVLLVNGQREIVQRPPSDKLPLGILGEENFDPSTTMAAMQGVASGAGGGDAGRHDRGARRPSAGAVQPGKQLAREGAPARVYAAAVAVAVSAFLCLASFDFVLAERDGGNLLAYGIPQWALQAAMPLGFAFVALRLLAGVGRSPVARAATALLAAALAFAAAHVGADPAALVAPGLAAIFLAAGDPAVHPGRLFPRRGRRGGAPDPGFPGAVRQLSRRRGAGGGAAHRLFHLVHRRLRRHHPGAGRAANAAVAGGEYPERAGIGLITGGCSLGVLLPPALPLILYAIIARQPIETMFLAALLPALVMTAMLAWLGIRRQPGDIEPIPFCRREAGAALMAAKWELAIPLVTFGGLASGYVTPTGTAALTALYAFIIEVVIYRDLSLARDVPRVMVECGLLVGGIILILGMALGFTNYLIDAQIPDLATEWVRATITSPPVFLLALNLLLLLVGAFMDIFSAIIVVTPLIVPIGLAFGIDPVHLGIIFLANMELGFLTPPVGMNLFFASYRFGKPMGEIARAVLPALGVLALGVLVITYVPALSTWLPGLMR